MTTEPISETNPRRTSGTTEAQSTTENNSNHREPQNHRNQNKTTETTEIALGGPNEAQYFG